jgi:signal transduction histidine kinase
MKYRFRIFIHLLILQVVFFYLNGEGSSLPQVKDSLIRVISEMPDNTLKADNLVKLVKNYIALNQTDSALYYIELEHALSNRLDYTRGQADGLYLKSHIYRLKKDLKTSLGFTDDYIELYLLLNDSLMLAKGYYQLGNIHKDMGDYEFSLYYFQKSLSYSLPLEENTLLIGNYNSIGSIYLEGKAKHDSSAYYFMKAMALCEQIGDQKNLSTTLNNLGNVYFDDKQYDMSRKYYNMSLEINQKESRQLGMALNYNGLGRIESAQNNYREAMNYYNMAAELFRNISDIRGTADVNNNLGDAYFKQKKYDLALEKFNLALDIYRNILFDKGIILTLLNISAVYSEMGRVKEAMALQDSCLLLANQRGSKSLLLLALRNISDNLRKTGDFEDAYYYLYNYTALNDSIFSIEQSKAIRTAMLKYDKEKDQARILTLEKDNLTLEKDNLQKTNQRNAYMFTGLGILIMTMFIVIYFRQKAKHERVLAHQQIHRLEEEKKLMAAKLLVEGQEEERKRIATELHDGLGVLLSATRMQFSTISDKSPENKVLIEKATRMLEQASGDVRKISHNMMPGLLTKLGFYEAVEDLFEHIGDTKDLNAVCRIEGDQERLAENKEIMLYRIVQEMVNNSLKHAEARNIELNIKVLPEMLEMKYSDDGKGFDIATKMESGSIGLKSIQSRVNFLNGKIEVESKPGEGVQYALQVPF